MCGDRLAKKVFSGDRIRARHEVESYEDGYNVYRWFESFERGDFEMVISDRGAYRLYLTVIQNADSKSGPVRITTIVTRRKDVDVPPNVAVRDVISDVYEEVGPTLHQSLDRCWDAFEERASRAPSPGEEEDAQ